MKYSLTNDENIIDVLFNIIPVIEICEKIVHLKNDSEKADALKYHIESWDRIAGAYFKSIEKRYPTYSYVGWQAFSGPVFIALPDNISDFYDVTGCPYQVRETILHQIEALYLMDKAIGDAKVWFYEDDKKLSILTDKILQKMKCGQ